MKNYPPWVCSLDGARGVNSACVIEKKNILIVLKIIPEWEPFLNFGHSANCFISYMWKQYQWWWFSCQVVSHICDLHGLQPTRLLCPWDLPSKNTGVGYHFLFQGIFLTQGSNLHLPHCRWSPVLQVDSLPLRHQRNPWKAVLVNLYIFSTTYEHELLNALARNKYFVHS